MGRHTIIGIKVTLIQDRRHPGRSVSEDPGSPAVDLDWRCRIGVRHDEIYYVIKHQSSFGGQIKNFCPNPPHLPASDQVIHLFEQLSVAGPLTVFEG